MIKAKNLSISLGGKVIIDDITCHFTKQTFIGIIGPNGSGKSTLLKAIYRVLTPTGGIIYLDNQALNSYSYKRSAKKMAVVAQHNYYNFDFTVEEVVLMGRTPHKKHMERDNIKDYQIVEGALKKVDMYAYKKRIFSTLSGGEQQRIILARALAQQAHCLILDEPTNHLDIKHQIDILNLVKSTNFTVIAALHDLNVALAYCDYLYVLKEGTIAADGVPSIIITPSLIKAVYQVDADILTSHDNSKKVIRFF